MKIKAAILHNYNKPMTIEEVEIDNPAPHEVRIKTMASGVCHSDLHNFHGHNQVPLPMVLGHEAAGIVESVGDQVSTVRVGDHVALCTSSYCGNCPPCLAGHLHLCSNQKAIERPNEAKPRLCLNGESVHQGADIGAFAEMMLVNERKVVKIADDMPLDQAAILGCAVTTGLGAAMNTAKVTPGSSVAVFGAGGIGVSIIQGARIAGARQIIAIDLHDHKLEAARNFGATHTINGSTGNTVKEIKKLSNGGVDFSFDAVGNKLLAEQCLYSLRQHGLATLVGAVYPVTQPLELIVGHFFVEKRIQGCLMGSNRFQQDIPRYVDLYKQGRLKLDDMITKRLRLEDVNEAFRAMETAEVIRSVLVFD